MKRETKPKKQIKIDEKWEIEKENKMGSDNAILVHSSNSNSSKSFSTDSEEELELAEYF